MSKIKKIVLMIIICLACISIHNVSLAATTSWKSTRSFLLSKGSCSNKKHTGCTTYSTGRITMHIGADGFLSGSAKPYLDKDVGLICLQHDAEAETFFENGENGMEIQYRMTIDNKKVTVIPMSEAAKSASGSSTISTNSKSCARVAYILSHISDSAGEDIRKSNGAQGALWRVIKSFLDNLKEKTAFDGVVVSQYQGKWDDVANALKYYNEAKAYSNISIFSPSTIGTKIKVSEFDNNYYIIGPFKMKFSDGSYTDDDGNVTRFAGFKSAKLKMDTNQLDSKNWNLCNKEGKKITEPTSEEDFYIKVKKSGIGAKGILTIETRKMNVYANFYTMTSKKGRQDQAIVTEAGRYYDNEKVTFEFDTFGNLRIAKEDADSGNALSGIGFTIKNSNGKYVQALDANKDVQASATGIIKNIQFTGSASKATKFLTDDKGIIELHNIPVDTYTINETSVGNHYAYVLNKNNISWEANGKTSTGQSVKVLIKGQSPTIANSTNTMLQDKYVTIATVKNKKQVGGLRIEKRDERDKNKKLPDVEFVIKSSASNNAYIKVKATGSNVTNDTNGWATRIVGSSTINDTEDINSNPTLEYTTSISDATVFVTNSDGIIEIQNLISIKKDGTTMIEYTLEEIKNPNYGYLSGNNGEIKYTGKSITPNGTIKLTTSSKVEIVATNPQKYIRLAGFVWEDNAPGKDSKISNEYEDTDYKVEGIQVKLYKNGTFIAETTTDENGEYKFGSKEQNSYKNTDYVDEEGKETGNLRIEDLSQYYVEFEYDGLKYTSVLANTKYDDSNYSNTSKAAEVDSKRADKKDRETVNSDFSVISYNQAYDGKNNPTYGLEYTTNPEQKNVSRYNYNKYWEYNDEKEQKTLRKVKVVKVKDGNNKNYEVIASTQKSEFNLEKAWNTQFKNTYSEVLTGINLGIEKRAQADLAVSSDLNTVEIKINTGSGVYMNTYTYAKRGIDNNKNNENNTDTEEKDPTTFGIETKFGTKSGSYSARNLNLYTRRIYESDLAYNNGKAPALMEVYVTYKIRVKNQSTKLTSRVNEIANYFDSRYTMIEYAIGNKDKQKTWKKESELEGQKYKVGYIDVNTEIGTGKYIDIEIKFQLDNAAVSNLITTRTTLNNVSEITSFSTIENEKPYAAIDVDSNPGNASIKLSKDEEEDPKENDPEKQENYKKEIKELDTTTYEDDTDMAPSLILLIEKDNPTRGLSGTVFEDEDKTYGDTTHPGQERLGDGILNTTKDKNRIKNVKVELLEYNAENTNYTTAKLYQPKIDAGRFSTDTIDAIVYTNELGEYSFNGVIPGRYLIRYTYGDNTWIVNEHKEEIEKINARDYKSTIITSNLIEKALRDPNKMGDLNWILTYEDNKGQTKSKSKDVEGLIRYSDAIDDINQRNNKDDLYFGSYLNFAENSMTSDTAIFDVGVEYSEVKKQDGFDVRVSYTDYKDEYDIKYEEDDKEKSTAYVLVFDEDNNMLKVKPTFYAVNPYQDFGLIERPRQEYVVNKRISNLKVTLANGQILINGNPYKNNPNGIEELEEPSENPLPYVKAVPGLVTAEIDNEILQAAKLNIEYTISIKNNSELDYDYIENQDYYYYGVNGTNQINAKISKVVDYMENGLVYDEEANEKEKWEIVTPEKLTKYNEDGVDKQLIATGQEINGVKYNVYDGIKQGYTIAITNAFDKGIEVTGIESTKIYGSKVLSTSSENGINVLNHTEIIETKGIRPIKDSIPGNYNPNPGPKEAKINEPDDDWTKLTITPPLGLTDNKTYVILITATALLVLAGGVYIIKKKVI